MSTEAVARAFSGHRFDEAAPAIAPDATWRLPGQADLVGRDAILAACAGTTEENVGVETTWLRFVSTGDGDVVAVDAVGRYAGPDGVSVVSSCDVYEFADGLVRTITSYAVEVDPDDVTAPPAQR